MEVLLCVMRSMRAFSLHHEAQGYCGMWNEHLAYMVGLGCMDGVCFGCFFAVVVPTAISR